MTDLVKLTEVTLESDFGKWTAIVVGPVWVNSFAVNMIGEAPMDGHTAIVLDHGQAIVVSESPAAVVALVNEGNKDA